MPRDNEHPFRRWAGDKLMDAAKRTYCGGEFWYIRHAIKEASDWLHCAEEREAAAEEAARIERECAAFNAAMAECAQ